MYRICNTILLPPFFVRCKYHTKITQAILVLVLSYNFPPITILKGLAYIYNPLKKFSEKFSRIGTDNMCPVSLKMCLELLHIGSPEIMHNPVTRGYNFSTDSFYYNRTICFPIFNLRNLYSSRVAPYNILQMIAFTVISHKCNIAVKITVSTYNSLGFIRDVKSTQSI